LALSADRCGLGVEHWPKQALLPTLIGAAAGAVCGAGYPPALLSPMAGARRVGEDRGNEDGEALAVAGGANHGDRIGASG
jgi:hypothetical protein